MRFSTDFLLGSPQQTGRGGEPLQLWAIEGLAEYLTLGPVETHTAMWMRDAVRNGTLPKIADLANPEYFRTGGVTRSGRMSPGDGET